MLSKSHRIGYFVLHQHRIPSPHRNFSWRTWGLQIRAYTEPPTLSPNWNFLWRTLVSWNGVYRLPQYPVVNVLPLFPLPWLDFQSESFCFISLAIQRIRVSRWNNCVTELSNGRPVNLASTSEFSEPKQLFTLKENKWNIRLCKNHTEVTLFTQQTQQSSKHSQLTWMVVGT